MIAVEPTRQIKYDLVARLLNGCSGTLVDVGARDRILRRHLKNPQIHYRSSDTGEGHDWQWNLERPLPCADAVFDYVVALDVLEHVERFHDAFDELLRVCRRKLFISLPNMTHLSHRARFFFKGRLGVKYSLLPQHQGDRHRWLTHYDDITAFMNHRSAARQLSVKQFNWIHGYSRVDRVISFLPLPPGLKTYTVIFEITKPTP